MNQSTAVIDGLIDFGFEPAFEEGVNDPFIFKWIAMAGGTGSGKSFTAVQMFKGLGLKLINSDAPLEKMAKAAGIDLKKELGSPRVQKVLRPGAKRVTVSKQKFAMGEKLGIVWDGTGADFDKMVKAKKDADDRGYDTHMVFVNTSLEVSLARNAKRDRVVPVDIATQKWEEAQGNLQKFRRLFVRNMVVIESEDVDDATFRKKTEPELRRAGLKLLRRPIKNPLAHEWIRKELEARTGKADPKLVAKIIKGRG